MACWLLPVCSIFPSAQDCCINFSASLCVYPQRRRRHHWCWWLQGLNLIAFTLSNLLSVSSFSIPSSAQEACCFVVIGRVLLVPKRKASIDTSDSVSIISYSLANTDPVAFSNIAWILNPVKKSKWPKYWVCSRKETWPQELFFSMAPHMRCRFLSHRSCW